MPKEKPNKKPKSKLAKTLSWIFSIFFGALISVILVFQITGFATRGDNYGVPNYFGYQVMVVISDSMEPEIMTGDTVIVKKVDPSTLKVGDDVTFMYDLNGNGQLYPVTHRLLEIKAPNESSDGKYNFVAHGINAHSNQGEGDMTVQKQYFNQDVLLGTVIGSSAFLGFCFNFLTQWYGLVTVLLIPALYLVVSSIIDIVKALDDKDDDDKNDDHKDDGNKNPELDLSSEDIKRLKQELLDEMLAKKKVSG